MTKVRRAGVVAAAAAALAVAVLASTAAAGPGSPTETATSAATTGVSVRDDVFSPRSASVASGGRVVWTWKGDNPHNVRFRKVPSGASKPRSATKTSGRFARTFRKRGTYRYVCTIHADVGMRGTVNVR